MIASFDRWPIRSKILSLVSIPLIITASLITLYHTVVGFEQDKQSIQSSSQRLLTQAANAGQLAFFAEDKRSLNNLAKSIMIDSQITRVHFFDENKAPIDHDFSRGTDIGLAPFSDGDNFLRQDHWYFVKAVLYKDESFSDNPEQDYLDSNPVERPIGWIAIAIDLKESKRNQQAILINNLLITLVTTVIALWLAIRLSRTITDPIRKITDAVHHFSDNDFSTRLQETSKSELGLLERGFNKLAMQVNESQQILQSTIDKVSADWIKAVEDLELKNDDLIAAKIRAEEANKSKDDFLARMSHELRTPLTAIMGFVSILEKTAHPQTRKEYIDMILATSSVLLSTINDILDFSKLKSNTFKLNPSHFNLEHLLRNILDMHSLTACKKGIELNLLIDADVPIEIEVDFDKLKKVLNNIIANAIKFTETGDIIVFISNSENPQGQPLIAIEVKDTGRGIEESDLKHLFDPFYQCDESSTRQHEGTGLGLSIAKDFVELMGGRINAESEPEEGTEISFSFEYQLVPCDTAHPQNNSKLNAYLFDANPWTRRAWRNILLKHTRQVYAPRTSDALLHTLQLETQQSLLLLGFDLFHHTEIELKMLLGELRATYQGPLILAISENGVLDKELYQREFSPLIITRKPFTQSRLNWAIDQIEQNITQPTPLSPTEPSDDHHQEATAPSALHGLRILLAEDNEFNQRLFNDMLLAAGASVEVASDGQFALEASQAHIFDLMILDLHMPRINGVTLSKTIRDTGDKNSRTPIMLLTADILSQLSEAHKDAGIDALCHKPIDEAHFFETIHTLCNKPQPKQKPKRALLQLNHRELSAEVEHQMTRITQAIETQDMDLITSQTHQLSGIIGMANISFLSAALSLLNSAIENQSIEGITLHFGRLQKLWLDSQT